MILWLYVRINVKSEKAAILVLGNFSEVKVKINIGEMEIGQSLDMPNIST